MQPTIPFISPITSELLTRQQVSLMLGLSEGEVRSLATRGAMPKPVVLSGRHRWIAADIRAWIAAGCARPNRAASPRQHSDELLARRSISHQ